MRITSLGFGSYNTALLMYNKIRVALGNVEFKQLISYVEVDETYVGGKARSKHKGLGGRGDMGGTGGTGKTIVFGAVQRKGIARVQACAAVEPSLRRPRTARLTLLGAAWPSSSASRSATRCCPSSCGCTWRDRRSPCR